MCSLYRMWYNILRTPFYVVPHPSGAVRQVCRPCARETSVFDAGINSKSNANLPANFYFKFFIFLKKSGAGIDSNSKVPTCQPILVARLESPQLSFAGSFFFFTFFKYQPILVSRLEGPQLWFADVCMCVCKCVCVCVCVNARNSRLQVFVCVWLSVYIKACNVYI